MASRNLACVVMITLLCGITLAAAPSADPAGNKDDQAVQAALDRALPAVQLNQTPLSDTIDFLHDITHVNFVVNWKALKSAGVEKSTPLNANLHHVRLSGLLKVMLDQIGNGKLGYIVDQGTIKISTRDDLGETADATRPTPAGKEEKALQTALDEWVPSVQFNQIGLSDALDFLRDLTGTNIVVNWQAVKAAGFDETTPVTVHLTKVRFYKALKVTLDQASDGKLGYSIDQNIITISVKNESDKTPATTRPAGNDDKDVLAALDRTLPSVPFNAIPLGDALDFLRDITQTNVVVNWKAIEAAGIKKETPVTTDLKDVKFSAVLKTVLDQAGDGKLDYVVDEGIINIVVKDENPAANKPGK